MNSSRNICRHLFAGLLFGLALCSTNLMAQVSIGPVSIAAGGITPGDSPGYPATISVSGSYKLGSNLSSGGGTAVEITASNVTLDLNGYTIDGGAAACQPNIAGPGNTCSGSATIISLIDATDRSVTIRNGMVRRSKGNGIAVGESSRIDDVSSQENRGFGIISTGKALVSNVHVSLNGMNGFFTEGTAILSNVSADYNNASGIYSTPGSMHDIHASFNVGSGIMPGFSTVVRAEARHNGDAGIWGGSVVRDAVSQRNAGPGFRSNYGGLYINDWADDNDGGGFDLNAGGTNCYSQIWAKNNATFQISGGTALNGTTVTCM